LLGLLASCQEAVPYQDEDIGRTALPVLDSGSYEVWRGGPLLSDGTNDPVTPVVNDAHVLEYWGTGTGSTLYIGSSSLTSSESRALIRWDLSFIPANATVTSAVATVTFNRSNQQQTVSFHRVTSEWTESAPTWDTAFDPAVAGSFTSDTWSGTRDVDLTSLAQLWVSGAPNYGVLLEQSLGGGTTQVYSSEQSTASRRPRLVISFDVPPPAPPEAPQGLVASAGNASVALTWTATSNASGYSVARSTVSGTAYVTLATGLSALDYLDTDVTNGVTYYYVITASNAAGESPPSDEVAATPELPPPPDAPTWVAVTADDTLVQLSWTASAGATGYNLRRATTSGGPYALVTATPQTEHTDTGLENGVTYYYVVTAESASGEGEPSDEAAASPAPPPPPAPPTDLVATAGDQSVALTWTASTGATSYLVKRSTASGGDYAAIASTTSASYDDTGLENGTTYYYVVSAENSGGTSADSAEVAATPAEPPPVSDPIRIAYIADFGNWGGGSNPDPNAQAVADMVASWNPDFVVTGGDNVYDTGADAYPRIIGQYYGGFVAEHRFFPTMGNHDWLYGHADHYYAYFSYLPGNRRYYEMGLGADDIVRMFAIDTDWQEPDGTSQTSIQASWLHDQLAASPACFALVVFHNPSVASSISGTGPTWGFRWPFADWGAEVVLQAHVHAYERLLVDRIPHFINGASGR